MFGSLCHIFGSRANIMSSDLSSLTPRLYTNITLDGAIDTQGMGPKLSGTHKSLAILILCAFTTKGNDGQSYVER